MLVSIDLNVRGRNKSREIRSVNGSTNAMKKQHLPEKICLVCERPFSWRKKWEKVWDEVKYCSEKCKKNKHAKHVSD